MARPFSPMIRPEFFFESEPDLCIYKGGERLLVEAKVEPVRGVTLCPRLVCVLPVRTPLYHVHHLLSLFVSQIGGQQAVLFSNLQIQLVNLVTLKLAFLPLVDLLLGIRKEAALFVAREV